MQRQQFVERSGWPRQTLKLLFKRCANKIRNLVAGQPTETVVAVVLDILSHSVFPGFLLRRCHARQEQDLMIRRHTVIRFE